jgi:WD40 repeat protein
LGLLNLIRHDATTRVWVKGHTDFVNVIAFSPDSKRLAVGSNEEVVRLWDLVSRQEVTTLKGHQGGVIAVAFSPHGRILATGGRDNTVKLWYGATDQEIAVQSR